MVQAQPDGEPRVVAYQFRYEIADDFIEKTLDEDGVELAKAWTLAFELRDLPTAELRHRARVIQEVWGSTPGYPVLDQPTEDAVQFIQGAEHWIADATKALGEQESAERRQAELAEIFEHEKAMWIQQHGSARLRRANDRGYKVNRLYAQERVRQEYPRFWLDTSGDASWGERTDPSERSLDVEDVVREEVASRGASMDVRIIWLTDPPPELASKWEIPELEWDEQEAILVQPYLDRYRLFLPVNSDLWKSADEAEGADDDY